MNVLKRTINFFLAMLAGIILTVGTIYLTAPKWMIIESESKFPMEETVELIKEEAKNQEWTIPNVLHLNKSMKKAGYEVLPTTVIDLCMPKHAIQILNDDDNRKVSSMMPCRVSVYQKQDGTVIVSRMNTGIMSRVFGGTITKTMAIATQDIEKILAAVNSQN